MTGSTRLSAIASNAKADGSRVPVGLPAIASAKAARRPASSFFMNPFQTALRDNVRRRIRDARADGTVSMSLNCLIQCVPPPSHHIDGAPAGANGYEQMFRETCRSSEFARFIQRQ